MSLLRSEERISLSFDSLIPVWLRLCCAVRPLGLCGSFGAYQTTETRRHRGRTEKHDCMADRPLKIVRIIARLNVGGPAKHVAWLTAGLQQPEYDSLLVAGTVPEGEGDMSYFADSLGVKPQYIEEMSREISWKDIATVWKLYRLFVRERPDIIHTHTAKAGTVGRVAGFCYRWMTPKVLLGQPRACRFVHTYHGHIFHSYYSRSLTKAFIFIEKALAKLVTDRIVVISEQQGDEINRQFGVGNARQFRVIPLGLDLAAFDGYPARRHKFREELGIDENTVLVGIVGRLTEIKNHEMFLRSVAEFKQVKSETRNVRFVILGDGNLRKELESQTRSLGLENDVVFAGSRTDLEYFYPALDVVALTSRNEGTPLTLIEAMANGRAVVSTAVGGVVDLLGAVVKDEDQYLICERGLGVAAGDEKRFAAALSRLINDDSLRTELGQRGLEFVQKKYRKERLLEDIRNLYDELMRVAPATVELQSVLRTH
jgi:glycosyltransferase involved in cell wall biosynthesis